MAGKYDKLNKSAGSLFKVTDALLPGNQEPEVIEREIMVTDPNAIVPQADGGMTYKRFTLTPIGLIVPDDVTPEELLDVGQVIHGLQNRIQWIVGDLMNSMERTWGKSYQTVASELGYEVRTVQEWASICKRVSIRIETLSFGHHQLIASLDAKKQSHWLNKAIENGWSVAELRKAIKGKKHPALPTTSERFTRDFEQYRKGLADMGQGDRAELRQLAYDLILQIDQMEGVNQ